ncbi:YaaA family protein [Corynebacterium kroppenstedtii]|uniref:YaaA family protein n=1 Tax=Corynebacterium sp. PCR 32 TaxID=3351342 RepID=UPI003094F9EC
MLIILPPSETKSFPHTDSSSDSHIDDARHLNDSDVLNHCCRQTKGSSLNWDTLHFPSLTPIRRSIAHDLTHLCDVDNDEDKAYARKILGLSARLDRERAANATLLTNPTAPAITVYTGVLYDALAPSGRVETVTKANYLCSPCTPLPLVATNRLAIGSALFGIVLAHDLIPHYRLSGDVVLAQSTIRRRWTTTLTDALVLWRERQDPHSNAVFDFRSGPYRSLGPVPGATELRIEAVDSQGKRAIVSHFNKFYKGIVARHLATAPDCSQRSAAELLAHVIEEKVGFTAEVERGIVKGTQGDLVTMLIPR